jgi:hypothetical protein
MEEALPPLLEMRKNHNVVLYQMEGKFSVLELLVPERGGENFPFEFSII